jgi:hypothetical protein
VWHICREDLEFNFEEPRPSDTLEEWWITERCWLRGAEKKDLDTVVCLVCYALLKNRNAWVFENVARRHRPISIARLVAEKYNMLKVVRRDVRAAEHDTARE